jgi:hypothetical protein
MLKKTRTIFIAIDEMTLSVIFVFAAGARREGGKSALLVRKERKGVPRVVLTSIAPMGPWGLKFFQL